MGEIKSVKVDNWGVFFLQKLQNFFNKTDYCDLTLQFRDNSQLKVHRLVLSACTDYFNVLEQTCEVVDDAIIMPNGLQADVVVPIVNFMYTGTLEFELKMYNRLLRTAKDMNMTVLLKLLEAHRRTMEMHPQKVQTPTSPKPRRKAGSQTAANLPVNAGSRSLIQPNQNKRIIVGSNVGINAPQQNQQPQRIPPGNTLSRLTSAGPIPVKQQIGSTTFTRIKQENEQETNTPPQGGYTLLKQSQQIHHQQATPSSPFEQLRKGYNNNKRPTVSTFISPPAKRPNLEDVKEFAEQQRMRKQIAAEYGDDDYDASNIMDDDNIHNDDDDDEMAGAGGQAQQMAATSTSAGSQTSNQQQSEDPPGTTTIIVKHEGPDKPPTIVVKENYNSKMNHAKIISEVLRQYPHLVKSNKNIKLKIMPNPGGQTQKIVVKKEAGEDEKSTVTAPPLTISKLPTNNLPMKGENQPLKPLVTNIVSNKPKALQQPQILPQVKTNTTTNQSSGNKPLPVVAAAASTTTASVQSQKRRIDSKTMHALIALGAENTTGPWLCLRCGRNGHPISIPSYRGFRRHLINTHKEIIDPALCEHCGWRSSSKRELHFHMQMEHKVRTNLYIFPECQLCNQMCIDSDGLNQHLIDSHPDENKQQCIYCNKIFPEELQLYTHMKTFHKKQALEDGIIDYSDDENNHDTLAMPPPEFDPEMPEEQQLQHEELAEEPEKKVKILSDISLPIASSIITTDSFCTDNVNIPESTSEAATEEYLHEDHTETKFVAADGSEVILTDEQRKEILSQLNQEHEGSSVVMVLNEQQQYVGGEQQLEQGAISHDETSQATTVTNEEQPEHEEEEHHDDSQIYSELKSQISHMDEDSTSQTAAAVETVAVATNDDHDQEHEEDVGEEHEAEQEHEHEQQQPDHLEESKESIDNLEWAENLISEQDLADEVSQTTADTTGSNKPEEKDITKEDEYKSQDEISKKLKELTGDWSEDEDEDMPEEEPMLEAQLEKKVKDVGKEEMLKEEEVKTDDIEMDVEEEETNKIEKDHQIKEKEEKETEEDEHKDSSTFGAEDKEETEKNKKTSELPEPEDDNIDEDDIDLALKSLHNEDLHREEEGKETKENEQNIEKEEKDDEKSETTEKSAKTIELVEEKNENIEMADISSKDTKDEEEVKKTKEIKAIAEAESSSVMEVDEETKKDLIDSLLKEQPENKEDQADAETPTTTVNDDVKIEEDSKTRVENKAKAFSQASLSELTETESTIEDEFLDITPKKLDKSKKSEISSVAPSTSSTAPEVVGASSTTATTTKDTISSEDRVKSLISEWGDDDDDDDDTDLTANL